MLRNIPTGTLMLVLFLTLSMLATVCLAQYPPDPNNSYANYAANPLPVSVFTSPNGMGNPLSGCFAFGGITVSAIIRVTLIGAAGLPVPGVPAADIWLQTSLGGLALCPYNWPPGTWPGYVTIADGPTNAAGATGFSLRYFAGGQTRPAIERCEVWTLDATGAPIKINGTDPTGGPPNSNLDIQFNSPDINRDQNVNLSDVVIFAADYSGPYNYRSDFFWDGIINLSDLVLLAPMFGAFCP